MSAQARRKGGLLSGSSREEEEGGREEQSSNQRGGSGQCESIMDAGSISDLVPRARMQLSHKVTEARAGQNQFPGFQAHIPDRICSWVISRCDRKESDFLPHYVSSGGTAEGDRRKDGTHHPGQGWSSEPQEVPIRSQALSK